MRSKETPGTRIIEDKAPNSKRALPKVFWTFEHLINTKWTEGEENATRNSGQKFALIRPIYPTCPERMEWNGKAAVLYQIKVYTIQAQMFQF